MDETTSLIISPGFRLTINQAVMAWLKTKTERSNSEETRITYTALISQFRGLLQGAGLDLDGDPALIAMLAEGWAGTATRKERVSPATYNQRIATLSSFYKYAIKHGILKENPMVIIERRPVEARDYAYPLEREEVQRRLALIDRRTLPGLRDYALLSIAVTTGRRSFELANMRLGDLTNVGEKICVLWPRCKGGKVMSDILAPQVIVALVAYLVALYDNFNSLPPETPIWLSFARNETRGQPLGKAAISDIVKKHFGTTKVHATRHTFAVRMEEAGAKLSEIGARLGHNNLSTTSDYMRRLHSSENIYAEKLAEGFGI